MKIKNMAVREYGGHFVLTIISFGMYIVEKKIYFLRIKIKSLLLMIITLFDQFKIHHLFNIFYYQIIILFLLINNLLNKYHQAMKRKKIESENIVAFDAFYNHLNEPQYPFLLASNLQKTSKQFQKSRSIKLLGEWIREYQNLSEVNKYKYFQYMPKIQKILVNQFMNKIDMSYCLSYFFYLFHSSWKQFNLLLKELLNQSDSYVLDFIWYVSFNFVQKLDPIKQFAFCNFLSQLLEEPLRKFECSNYETAKKILEIIYMINIQECRLCFKQTAQLWVENMQKFESICQGEAKLEIIMNIIKNRIILIHNKISMEYWVAKIQTFIEIIEMRVYSMSLSVPLDIKILDNFIHMLCYQEVADIILKDKPRYLKSLIVQMKPNIENPDHIFNIKKYCQIRVKLYEMFYMVNVQDTYSKVEQILKKFTQNSIAVLNQQDNFFFLDSITERPLKIDEKLIESLIKMLANSHIRRALSIKNLIVLTKLIHSTIQTSKVSDQVVGLVIKAFVDCINQKLTDPNINELKMEINKLFYKLITNYTWEDMKKADYIFSMCQQFEKNSKKSQLIIIQILIALISKYHTVLLATHMHRTQQIVNDIYLKIIYDKTILNVSSFVSLIIIIYQYSEWKGAKSYIHSVCEQNKMKYSKWFELQALTLIKKSFSSTSQEQILFIEMLLSNIENWRSEQKNANLVQIQLFFHNLPSKQAHSFLKKIDDMITNNFTKFYEDSHYYLMMQISTAIFPSVASYYELMTLKSFIFVKQHSFDILARSFYKTTSIHVCTLFSSILLKSDDLCEMYKSLNKDYFLDYLYQGLNDFISKQNKYQIESVTIILAFKMIQLQPKIYNQSSKLDDFKTLSKNVIWWQEQKKPVNFRLLSELQRELMLPEYINYYQKTFTDYIQNYSKFSEQKKLILEKRRKEEQLLHMQSNNDDLD